MPTSKSSLLESIFGTTTTTTSTCSVATSDSNKCDVNNQDHFVASSSTTSTTATKKHRNDKKVTSSTSSNDVLQRSPPLLSLFDTKRTNILPSIDTVRAMRSQSVNNNNKKRKHINGENDTDIDEEDDEVLAMKNVKDQQKKKSDKKSNKQRKVPEPQSLETKDPSSISTAVDDNDGLNEQEIDENDDHEHLDDVDCSNRNSTKDERTVFVGNLPWNMKRKELKRIFVTDCGPIESVRIRCIATDPNAVIKLPESHKGNQKLHKRLCINTTINRNSSSSTEATHVKSDIKSNAVGYVVFVNESSVSKALLKNNLAIPDTAVPGVTAGGTAIDNDDDEEEDADDVDDNHDDGDGTEKNGSNPNATITRVRHIRVDRVVNPEPYDPTKTIFVGNLPYNTDEETLREHITAVLRYYYSSGGGSSSSSSRNTDSDKNDPIVHGVRVIRDKETFQCKGIGYVLLRDKDMVSNAVQLFRTAMDPTTGSTTNNNGTTSRENQKRTNSSTSTNNNKREDKFKNSKFMLLNKGLDTSHTKTNDKPTLEYMKRQLRIQVCGHRTKKTAAIAKKKRMMLEENEQQQQQCTHSKVVVDRTKTSTTSHQKHPPVVLFNDDDDNTNKNGPFYPDTNTKLPVLAGAMRRIHKKQKREQEQSQSNNSSKRNGPSGQLSSTSSIATAALFAKRMLTRPLMKTGGGKSTIGSTTTTGKKKRGSTPSQQRKKEYQQQQKSGGTGTKKFLLKSKRAASESKIKKRTKKLEKRVTKGMGKSKK